MFLLFALPRRGLFAGLDASSFVFIRKGTKSRKYIKVRFDGRLTVPGDRVLFMLMSVTMGKGLLRVPRERKMLLVQYGTNRGMINGWELFSFFLFLTGKSEGYRSVSDEGEM